MVALERCREIMKKHGCRYCDEDLLKIRDFLYQLAAIEYKIYQRLVAENENSNHLHKSIIGRTS